jgi:hypothetical protein
LSGLTIVLGDLEQDDRLAALISNIADYFGSAQFGPGVYCTIERFSRRAKKVRDRHIGLAVVWE